MKKLSVLAFGLALLGTLGACSTNNLSGVTNVGATNAANPPVFTTYSFNTGIYDGWETRAGSSNSFGFALVKTDDPSSKGTLTLSATSSNTSIVRVLYVRSVYTIDPAYQGFQIQLAGGSVSGETTIKLTARDANGGVATKEVSVSNVGGTSDPCKGPRPPRYCSM